MVRSRSPSVWAPSISMRRQSLLRCFKATLNRYTCFIATVSIVFADPKHNRHNQRLKHPSWKTRLKNPEISINDKKKNKNHFTPIIESARARNSNGNWVNRNNWGIYYNSKLSDHYQTILNQNLNIYIKYNSHYSFI